MVIIVHKALKMTLEWSNMVKNCQKWQRMAKNCKEWQNILKNGNVLK